MGTRWQGEFFRAVTMYRFDGGCVRSVHVMRDILDWVLGVDVGMA